MTPDKLKKTFDQVALLYDKARPRYPDELFSALVEVTNLQKDARLLEIGPATGIATKPLADRGFDITAVELGAALAEVAEHHFREYKNVRITTGAFEELAFPDDSFDLVYAATAFHWIEPAVKYTKPHRLLKDNGYLAIIHTNHISDEKGDAFFNASQPIYDKYDYTDKHQKPRLPHNDELKPEKFDDHLFELVHFECFPIILTYSARAFVELLNTFSNHLAAPLEVQQGFYREIEALIDHSFRGKIEKHFSMSLSIAKKR